MKAPYRFVRRVGTISSIAIKEGSKALVACTGDLFDLPTTWVASLVLRNPCYAYLFDDYADHWSGHWRTCASAVESMVLRSAAGVIVPNFAMREEYTKRHRLRRFAVISNPCDLDNYPRREFAPVLNTGEEIKIVYTGAIYEAQAGALRNLLDALRDPQFAHIRLHVYTSQSAAELARWGVVGPVEIHPYQDKTAIPLIQQSADILFLPLAFETPYPLLIQTASPGKMGELLASGRPVLVHAPAESFVSRYFLDHDCGEVVTSPDPTVLQRTLVGLIEDPLRQETVARKARARAESDFSVSESQRRFSQLLSSHTFRYRVI